MAGVYWVLGGCDSISLVPTLVYLQVERVRRRRCSNTVSCSAKQLLSTVIARAASASSNMAPLIGLSNWLAGSRSSSSSDGSRQGFIARQARVSAAV